MAEPSFIVRADRERGAPAPYDFRRPQVVSDRQAGAVRRAHDGWAKALAEPLAAGLGTDLTVEAQPTAEVLAVDFVRSRAVPGAFHLIRLGTALDGVTLALDVSPALAHALVERELGGGGAPALGSPTRPLTAFESRLLQSRLLPLFARAFDAAWQRPISLLGFDPDPRRLPFLEPQTPVLVAAFEVAIGEARETITLAYPAAEVRALLTDAADDRQPLAAGPAVLDDLPVEVRAEFGRVQLSVEDLLRLAPGDVLPLHRLPDAPVAVEAGAGLRFEADPGRNGPSLALRILTPPHPLR